jgi:hypothetical protein
MIVGGTAVALKDYFRRSIKTTECLAAKPGLKAGFGSGF